MNSNKNIFMIGLNDFNHKRLKSLTNFSSYQFHGLIPPEEAEDAYRYDIPSMLSNLENKLLHFPGTVDAVVTYIDFPISMMTPIICQRMGLTSPSLESIMKCQHKYWSRVVQKEIIPEAIPDFCLIDPFAKDPLATLCIEFPFWLKPVKSCGSYLGFYIQNQKEFLRAIQVIRAQIERMSKPFNEIMALTNMPDEIRVINGYHCLAEQLIGGHQCTLEGYVLNGVVIIHGIIDSIRFPETSSFFYYDYPSSLPENVQQRMTNMATKILHHMDYDNHPFNMEFFWDDVQDKIWLLEVNTRISQSHSFLFEKVDGASNHQITIEVALNRDPCLPYRQGQYKHAAKFFYRKWEDALVIRVPTAEEVEKIEQEIVGVHIKITAKEGMRLQTMHEQDSYSYEIAWIFIGADTQEELLKKYHQSIERLHFEFKEVQELPPGKSILCQHHPKIT